MHHAGRKGEHSYMENFHGDDIYPHCSNKHSCTYQSLPEHQVSKLCEYLTKRHIKSCQHMEDLNAFSNYVKTALNLGSSLKEVDWGGNIDISTHYILFIIHISTRTCHIHHKRGVTEVCHLGHFWLSYGRCVMLGSPTGHLVGLS